MGTKAQSENQKISRRRLATILIADICDYTSISEKDESMAIKLSDILYTSFKNIVLSNGGRVFNRIADGFLAEFPSVNSAMDSALQFSKTVKERHNLSPSSIDAEVRQGIHVGDVVYRDDGDILGHGVNIAARLQQNARRGTILISANVQNLLGAEFSAHKPQRISLNLKNISEPITAFQYTRAGVRHTFKPSLRGHLKPIFYTLAVIIVLSVGLFTQNHRYQQNLKTQMETVVAKLTAESSVDTSDISSGYIRLVLQNLQKSNIPSRQASFALLEEGNIGLAIERLENSLENMQFASAEYIETLHQIGALSYHYNLPKTRAAYETLIEIDETDTQAMIWLLRTYLLSDDPTSAIEIYQTSIKDKNLSLQDSLALQVDMAFSLMFRGEFEAALQLQRPLETELIKLGDKRLMVRWQIDQAFALERLDKLEESEALLISAITTMNAIGADDNLARAYNILGLIFQKKGDWHPEQEQDFFSKALDFYKKQYAVGVRLNKQREIATSLHYMGRMHLKINRVDNAEQNFIDSFRLAREIGNPSSEFKARLGLGQVAKIKGEQKEACRHVRKAEVVFEEKMGPLLGPTSREILHALGCGFRPIGL